MLTTLEVPQSTPSKDVWTKFCNDLIRAFPELKDKADASGHVEIKRSKDTLYDLIGKLHAALAKNEDFADAGAMAGVAYNDLVDDLNKLQAKPATSDPDLTKEMPAVKDKPATPTVRSATPPAAEETDKPDEQPLPWRDRAKKFLRESQLV